MNNSIRTAFNLYLNGSVHVSLAVFALVQMTFYFCNIPFDGVVSALAFFGTLFSYNFIKYAETIYRSKQIVSKNMNVIVGISVLSLIIAGISFFRLQQYAQLVVFGLLLLCVLYAVPINTKVPNLRNWAGIKIYIVSFCWAGVTLIVPVVNAGLELTQDIGIKFLQRFFLVLILILIFEIVDLQFDDKKLKTVPQTLGLKKTKRLIILLLIPFYFLEFLKVGFHTIQIWNNLVVVALVLFFTWKVSPKQTKYFTLFWVESVPIVWWLLIVVERFFSKV